MENISARTIVLFVTGILVAAVLGVFVTLRNNTYSTTEILDLEEIAQGTLLAYQSTGFNYGTGSLVSVLVNGGKIPSAIINTTTNPPSLITRWNTALTVTGTGNAFQVQLDSVPSANCIDILVDPGLAQYLSGITVGGTAATFPVTPSSAANTCGNATTQNVLLTFTGHP